MPLLCLSYILINVFDDLSLSYLQRHIVRNHQMSHLRTPEMIHFPFVLILCPQQTLGAECEARM